MDHLQEDMDVCAEYTIRVKKYNDEGDETDVFEVGMPLPTAIALFHKAYRDAVFAWAWRPQGGPLGGICEVDDFDNELSITCVEEFVDLCEIMHKSPTRGADADAFISEQSDEFRNGFAILFKSLRMYDEFTPTCMKE